MRKKRAHPQSFCYPMEGFEIALRNAVKYANAAVKVMGGDRCPPNHKGKVRSYRQALALLEIVRLTVETD